MEQSNLFRFSMDNALEMILVFDTQGRIVYTNLSAEKQLEYKDGLQGRSITEIFPGVFEERIDGLRFVGKSDGNFSNIMIYRGNKTCFPAKGRILTYPSLYNGRQVYICTASDISAENFLEKKATHADQEAEEAQKVKTEFVANVTHELRTPVNGILGNTQELLERESDEDKQKLLRLVERGCKDMHALINNILDFSKLEAGKFVLESRHFHFREMIDYVKGLHSNKIIEKGLDFSVTISPEVPECIIADELRIVQILNNLISNAYKFTSVGSIHVECVKTGQSGNRVELFFMVIDSGIGIAKADHDKLFKSFTQVDASISRKYGGTGLGLNICKQLIELMGGNIHVESEVGKGTIFSFDIWVELPEGGCILDKEGEEKMIQDAPQQDYSAMMSEKVLLQKLQSMTESQNKDKINQYGMAENKAEIDKKMSKLILSIEMDNWEKAEMFAENVKQLLEEAPREIKSAALRMKMAVQKGDYEKSTAAFENLKNML